MSDHERSPYVQGGDSPLAFEPRRPVRSGGPAPVTLVLSLLVLAAIGTGVFFLYRGGVRGANDAPQPVGAPIGDVRTLAPAQPQAPDAAAGLSIYKDTSADAAGAAPPAPAFVAPPETPTPRPQAGAVPPPPPPPATVKAAVPASTAPPAVAAKAREDSATTDAIATMAPTPAAEPIAKPADSGGGPAMIQIGAFASAAQADKGWDAAAGIAPGAMAGKGKKVEVVSRGGETFYRTSITGFSTRQEAKAVCDKLQAAGKTCFVR